jgi:hypothetical protein
MRRPALTAPDRSTMIPRMSLRKYLLLPGLIFVIGVVYWFASYEMIGTVLLIVFSAAMAVMGWILVPTVDNVGPTAPVDPDFEDPGR